MAGIYRLIAPNGKSYIGQSLDLDRRLRDYARRVAKSQRHLHRAVKKYGWDNFKVEILWETKHPELYKNLNVVLDTLEIAWIKKFDSVANGYNLQYGGANRGKVLSEETKQKMSAAQRGKVLSEEHRRKISAACRGQTFSEEHRRKIGAAHRGKTHSEEAKRKMSRGVVQYGIDGKKLKTWKTMGLAAGGDAALRSGITRVCKGERRTAGGSQWRYLSDGIEELEPIKNYKKIKNRKKGGGRPKKPVAQYTQEGKLVKTWESARGAYREIGVYSGSIHKACNGKGHTAGGFIWKFA